MAGGKGERFWPKSRKYLPKQFLSLTNDGNTMLQHTVQRIYQLVKIEDVFIVTNSDYKRLVMEQLPGIPEENILLEPISRNTAPCIGLAAAHIQKKYKDAIMLVLPSDHLIKFNELFISTLKDAIEIAKEDNNMVTLGITPTYPETGYGYINFSKHKENCSVNNVYTVEKFVEKPAIQIAKDYLESGKYLWNSGMFVWKSSTIMNNFKKIVPDMYKGLKSIENSIGKSNYTDVLLKEFNKFISESIDYAIMEKTDNIYTIPGSFGWDDVGSWSALDRICKSNDEGNIVCGNVITIDSSNSIIQGTNKLIATIGIEDLIIVDTNDALLICQKDRSQEVKKVIENLKICNRNEYL